MVRINLIHPSKLTDQHLIAEYNEILMLQGYARKFPSLEGIPEKYVLGKGHIKFFKNKLKYLKDRHESIKLEMKKRGFKTLKSIKLNGFSKAHKKDWNPEERDIIIIKNRLKEKLTKRPEWYRYYGEKRSHVFFKDLLE